MAGRTFEAVTGGVSLVARASGVSRRDHGGFGGIAEKSGRSEKTRLPIRQKGGGRKKAALKDPGLLLDLEKLLEPLWWNMLGREAYPGARQLLITADSGGSNGSRVRLCGAPL